MAANFVTKLIDATNAVKKIRFGGDESVATEYEKLAKLSELVKEVVDPDTWLEAGGSGRLGILNTGLAPRAPAIQTLAVYQTTDVIQHVEGFVNSLAS